MTRRDRTVVDVLAASESKSLLGSVAFNVCEEDLMKPLDIEWDIASAFDPEHPNRRCARP